MMTYVLNPDTAFIFSRNIHAFSSIGCGLDCINVVHAMSALFSTCAPSITTSRVRDRRATSG